ncbi:hypothetical protein RGQ29_018356 [Quercus rubra]|uniref:Uncharacterized protein n=1 Tax=Quercus rubra TaxID=3512 RepID=A0AAN7FQ16_QUERU|nr:hypothetical protein RGQ29_018356 [Quercus rubra]
MLEPGCHCLPWVLRQQLAGHLCLVCSSWMFDVLLQQSHRMPCTIHSLHEFSVSNFLRAEVTVEFSKNC